MTEAIGSFVFRKAKKSVALGALGFFVWIAVWQVSTSVGPLADILGLPSALETAESALGLLVNPSFWSALGQTLATTAIALVISIIIGLVLGVGMGQSERFDALLDPLTQFLRPVPAVVVLPLVLLIAGPTAELAIVLAVFGGLWPILVQAHVGVRDVDPVVLDTARSMSLPWRMIQTSVVLPSAIPYFATGIRIAAGMTLMLTIGAGVLGGAPGLGRAISIAQQTGDSALVFGMLVWAGALGLFIHIVLIAVERRLTLGRQSEEIA